MNSTDGSTRIQALGIGDTMVDLYTRASQLPPRGGNVWSSAVQMNPGGTTANVSANIACLGISSAFIGGIGSDPYGQYILDAFAREGVNTEGIFIKQDGFTGIVLAIIDDEGERTFVACARGSAYTLLTEADVSQIDFDQYDILHTSGVSLVEQPSRDAQLFAMKNARDLGKKIYYDPNLRLEGDIFPRELYNAQLEAISLSDVVLIGEEELYLMCKCKSIKNGSARLHEKGAGLIVVKQGSQGVSVFDGKDSMTVPSFKVQVCSTAGAGDAFDAGFIAAQLRGYSMYDSLVYANAVAGLKVMHKEARAVPSHEDVIAFLKERKIEMP